MNSKIIFWFLKKTHEHSTISQVGTKPRPGKPESSSRPWDPGDGVPFEKNMKKSKFGIVEFLN